MTVQELSQLYHLNREVEMDQRRLEELEGQLGPHSPAITGMPKGSPATDSAVERLIAEIVDLQAIIASKQIQCIHERARQGSITQELTEIIAGANAIGG